MVFSVANQPEEVRCGLFLYLDTQKPAGEVFFWYEAKQCYLLIAAEQNTSDETAARISFTPFGYVNATAQEMASQFPLARKGNCNG